MLGRIPEVGLALLREAGEVWAWDHDEPIPAEVRELLDVHLVESMDEVLRLALDGPVPALPKAGPELGGAATEPPLAH